MRTRPTALRVAIAAALATTGLLIATGCQPEPAPSATPGTASPTPSISLRTPGPSASPIETNLPQSFVVPGSCEDIYSADMLASLRAQNPPLNDPGVTMLSTENVELIETLDASADALRCTWGGPSEYGLATTVAGIDDSAAASLSSSLRAAGFGCEPYAGGELCAIEQRGITFDDEEYVRGETHYLGAGGVVATAWINFDPEGYTADIVAQLWG